jgi:hypothetical protein
MKTVHEPIDLVKYHATATKVYETWEVHMIREVGAQPPRDGERWNATYTNPAKQDIHGVVMWLKPQGMWLFVPDDGGEPLYAAERSLHRHGQIDIADAQYKEDKDKGLLYTQFTN